MNKLKIFLLTIIALVGLQVSFAGIANAALFDDAKQQACAGAALDNNGKCDTASVKVLDSTLEKALNILSIIVGVIAVIVIIVSGIRFVTSGGDSNKVASARSSIIYAVVGLIIAALAQFIVRFVVARFGK